MGLILILSWLIVAGTTIALMRWLTARLLLKLKGWSLALFSVIHVLYLVFAGFLWTRMILIMLNPSFDRYFWADDGRAREVLGVELHLLTYILITSGIAIAVDMLFARKPRNFSLGKDGTTRVVGGGMLLGTVVLLNLLIPVVIAVAMWSL